MKARLAEDRLVQRSLVEVCTVECSLSKVCPAFAIDPAEVCPIEVHPTEVRPTKVRQAKICLTKVLPAEIRPAKVHRGAGVLPTQSVPGLKPPQAAAGVDALLFQTLELLMLIIGHDASISSEGMEAISCGG